MQINVKRKHRKVGHGYKNRSLSRLKKAARAKMHKNRKRHR